MGAKPSTQGRSALFGSEATKPPPEELEFLYIIIPKYQQFQFWLYQTSQKLKQEIHKQGEGEGGTCLQCAFKHLPQPLRTHI